MATRSNTNYVGGDDVSFAPLYQGMISFLNKNQSRIDQQNKIEAQRKQKVLDDVNKIVGGINQNGLLPVDLPDYEKLYDNVKQASFRVQQNGYRPEDVMAVQQAKNELMNFVNLSKERGRTDLQTWNSVSTKLQDYDDKGASDYFKKRMETPTAQLTDRIPDFSQFRRLGDQAKASADLEAEIKRVNDSVLPSIKTNRTNLGGRDYRLDTVSTWQIPEEGALTIIDQLYQGNNNFRQTLDRLYGDVPYEQKKLAYYQANADRFSRQTLKSEAKSTPIVKVSVGDKNKDEADYVVENYPIAQRGNQMVNLPRFMQFNQPQTISGVITGINPETGRSETIQGTTKTVVTGVGVDQQGRKIMTIDNDGEPLIVDQSRYINRAGMSAPKRKAVEKANKNFDEYIRSSQSNSVNSPQTYKAKTAVKGR